MYFMRESSIFSGNDYLLHKRYFYVVVESLLIRSPVCVRFQLYFKNTFFKRKHFYAVH